MKTLITCLLCLLSMGSLMAQTSLYGQVTDQESGEPILFGSVVLYQNGVLVTGTETDIDGNYNFNNIDPGTYDVEAAYVGYATKKISAVKVRAGKANKLDIILDAGSVILDEVVVTAYKVPLIEQDNTTSGSTITMRRRGFRRNSGSSKRYRKGRKENKNYNPSIQLERSEKLAVGKGNKGKKRKKKADRQSPESYSKIVENEFIAPADEAVSTFSIDVDRAAYSNVRRFISYNQAPPKDAVRTEEMVNYFHYNYSEPEGPEPFAIHTELADCPWQKNHQLLHIGLQGKNMDAEAAPTSNLVFLIDVSGSMGSANKLPLVKEAMKLLVGQLRAQDKVSIVVYAGAAGLVLPPTSGADKASIYQAIDQMNSGGSTAGGAGIQLAYDTAKKNFVQGGNNRVILATDGDFNVGVSSEKDLEKLIEAKRKSGIYLSVLGFGMGNYQDSKLEILADKGNGNYGYIDNISEAKKMFVTEFGGTLFTIAKDVKIQIEFDPNQVKEYRLIGYENRLLQKEDFDDDTKDAGELGAGHTVTALYEIVPRNNKAEGDLAEIRLRYKLPEEEQSKFIKAPIANEAKTVAQTSDNFRFSASVAAYSLVLRDSKYKGDFNYDKIIRLANNSKGSDVHNFRSEFIDLVKRTKSLKLTAAR